jgi:hypothetical protein
VKESPPINGQVSRRTQKEPLFHVVVVMPISNPPRRRCPSTIDASITFLRHWSEPWSLSSLPAGVTYRAVCPVSDTG